jgi:rhamnose utilization protein RhaD (predicted bifunctional aldolase and dehydrogenase)
MGNLEALVELSRRYGSDPNWVLAGGGNTSFKERGILYIKASGAALGDISETGFCAMDRAALDAIWSKEYPAGTDEREAAVLADLMAARWPGETKRPSVETLMHGLFPQAYVVHSHPALVNGLACGKDGRVAFDRILSDIAIWVPFVEPGYLLAKTVKEAMVDFASRRGVGPAVMVMQNHGLLVAADEAGEIDRLSAEIVARLKSELVRVPDLGAQPVDARRVADTASELSRLAGGKSAIFFRADAETARRAASRESFAPLSSAFSPDHIVYAGHEFLYAETPCGLEEAWRSYVDRNGSAPKVAVVREAGAFGLCASETASRTALLLFADACKVAAYAESFGGYLHMSREKIDFIRNWEVERYRASVGPSGASEVGR